MAISKRLLIVFMAAIMQVNPAAAGELVINAVGDIMLAGSGNAVVQRFGCDHPFAATAGELHRGDITVGNLEAPLARGAPSSRSKSSASGPIPFAERPSKGPGFQCSPWPTITSWISAKQLFRKHSRI